MTGLSSTGERPAFGLPKSDGFRAKVNSDVLVFFAGGGGSPGSRKLKMSFIVRVSFCSFAKDTRSGQLTIPCRRRLIMFPTVSWSKSGRKIVVVSSFSYTLSSTLFSILEMCLLDAAENQAWSIMQLWRWQKNLLLDLSVHRRWRPKIGGETSVLFLSFQ